MELLVLMERAVEEIGTALDERVVCGQLAEFLIRHLCEAATVDLLPLGATRGEGRMREPLQRVASAGRAALVDSVTLGRDLSVTAMDEGHPITESVSLSGGPVHRLSVPLVAHGHLFGTTVAIRARAPFTDEDTAVAHFAARVAAVHLGHVREFSRVRSTALNLQRALMAEPGRPHPNLDLATRYLPAGGGALVGGDWFETVRLHFGRTLLVMGDVMGHGLDAAVDMNAYRSMLRYVASTDLPPHRVLRQLDAAVSEEGTRRPATCLLVRVDPARRVATFSSAGHPPPAVFAADGTGDLIDVPVGPPLGTGFGGYEPATRRLTHDETLLMYTDGLVERRDEDIDVSIARLAALRLTPGITVRQVLDEALDRLDAHHAEDDVAALAARVRHRPGPHLAGPTE